MDLAKLQKNVAEVTVEYADERLTLEYYPQRYTSSIQTQIVAAQSQERFQTEGWRDILLALLKGWDLTSDDQPVEITAEALDSLPVLLLMEVVGAIAADMSAPKTPRASSNGSSPGASSETSLTGGTFTEPPAS